MHCSTISSSSQQISGRLRRGEEKVHSMQTPSSNGPHHTACASMSKARACSKGSELGPLASSQATRKGKNLQGKHKHSSNRRALGERHTPTSISFNCSLTFYLQIHRALSHIIRSSMQGISRLTSCRSNQESLSAKHTYVDTAIIICIILLSSHT